MKNDIWSRIKMVRWSKLFNYVIGAGGFFYSIHQSFMIGAICGVFLMLGQAGKDLLKFWIEHQPTYRPTEQGYNGG
jgi:cytochrome bd-type quinol oxidase subunit 2